MQPIQYNTLQIIAYDDDLLYVLSNEKTSKYPLDSTKIHHLEYIEIFNKYKTQKIRGIISLIDTPGSTTFDRPMRSFIKFRPISTDVEQVTHHPGAFGVCGTKYTYT